MADVRSTRPTRRSVASGLAGLTLLATRGAQAAQTGASTNPPYDCTIVSEFKGGGQIYTIFDCSNLTDIDYISFALHIEYLQAEYYLNASTGFGLPVSDQGDRAGAVAGASRVAFSLPVAAAFAAEFGAEQRSHVEFLRQVIVSMGRVPVSRPAIDFLSGFSAVAQQAGLVGAGQTFNAFANDTNFLLGAYLLEDVAVTSYHYLLSQVTSATVLNKLAGLMAAEGYHAGAVRATLFGLGYASATNALSFVRDTRDGSAGTPAQGNDHGVGTVTAPTIVVGDGNAIAASRNTQQVKAILPAGSGGTLGAPFFPLGLPPAP